MNVQKLVENILDRCEKLGVSPSVAARDSGAGRDVISNMKRKGTQPSFDRICLLAQYLGVSVEELVGEELPGPSVPTKQEQEFMRLFSKLTQAQQELVIDQLQGIVDAKKRRSAQGR